MVYEPYGDLMFTFFRNLNIFNNNNAKVEACQVIVDHDTMNQVRTNHTVISLGPRRLQGEYSCSQDEGELFRIYSLLLYE